MDQHLNDAAAALAAGDPLSALPHVALRDDAPALALRGIAMAQLGELARAKTLLSKAVRAFGPRAGLARARCVTALAEVALAARELSLPLRTLRGALQTLDAHDDARNALHARLLLTRTLLLSGQLARAERALASVQLRNAPDMLLATAELIRAELALRRVDTRAAHAALERARQAANHAAIPALSREIAQAANALTAPAARLITRGSTKLVGLAEVERALASDALVLDACRRVVRRGELQVVLARKPVLFALLRVLAEAWPEAVPRDLLIARGFGVGSANPSHRVRLRVELGRLRKQLASFATLQADALGYRLTAGDALRVVVLAPATDGDDAALIALLGDGASWSTSALALALGASQRTVQRALVSLRSRGVVGCIGRGRARRWSAAPIGPLNPQVRGLFAFGP
jgi:hypothetical protein